MFEREQKLFLQHGEAVRALAHHPRATIEAVIALSKTEPRNDIVNAAEYAAMRRSARTLCEDEPCGMCASVVPPTPPPSPPAVAVEPRAKPSVVPCVTNHRNALASRRAVWKPALLSAMPEASAALLAGVISNEQAYRYAVDPRDAPAALSCVAPLALEPYVTASAPRGRIHTDVRSSSATMAVFRELGATADGETWSPDWLKFWQNEDVLHVLFRRAVLDHRLWPTFRHFSIGSTNRFLPVVAQLNKTPMSSADFHHWVAERYANTGIANELLALSRYLPAPPRYDDSVAAEKWLVRQVGNPSSAHAYYNLIIDDCRAFMAA